MPRGRGWGAREGWQWGGHADNTAFVVAPGGEGGAVPSSCSASLHMEWQDRGHIYSATKEAVSSTQLGIFHFSSSAEAVPDSARAGRPCSTPVPGPAGKGFFPPPDCLTLKAMVESAQD